MANAARARGDLAGTERLFAESLELRRALARELDTPEARRDVSVSLINMASIAEASGNRSGAIAALMEARAAAETFGRLQLVSDATGLIAAIDQMLADLDATERP